MSIPVRLPSQASVALRALRPCGASFPWAQFTFAINGTEIETGAAEAVSISPAVALQLSVDACARSFTVRDDRIDADTVTAFNGYLSGVAPLSPPSARPLTLLFGHLWNSGLELALHPVPDFSVLSFDALNALLSEGGLEVDSEEALLGALIDLGADYFPLLSHIRWDFVDPVKFASALSGDAGSAPPESVWEGIADRVRRLPSRAGFASLIVADFPEIFAEFRGKRFSLLWRGSRDGFGAREFHSRCDGHANTLSLILDTEGNIFGGFTPVEWESLIPTSEGGSKSYSNCRKADPSLKSFLFTLRNPHNVPARKFALKAEKMDQAILSDASWGPYFEDIVVHDHCNATISSATRHFGWCYTNDTGRYGATFMTGAEKFKVKEIEVFEIGDRFVPANIAPAPAVAAPAGFASRIVADFPEIFAEFYGKRFALLWRGSRDGFGAREFHSRCDGHANTLLLILDTEGNIFGGFTPAEWESRGPSTRDDYQNCYEGDPSLKSFLFTLKNPHNVPARKFGLKAEKQEQAIFCVAVLGPVFGDDLGISNDVGARARGFTSNFGLFYMNDTGLEGKTFFAGSKKFKITEIEVFEVAD